MDTKTVKERSWTKLFLKLAFLTAFAVLVCVPLLTVAEYYRHVDKYIFQVKNGNSIESKRELDNLHYFYDLSKKWKVQWLADKYLFNDAPFYETADPYLINDWDKVIVDLKDKLDDPRSYPYANAKVQKAKAQYSAGEKKEAVEFVTKEIHQDYEKALRNCLDLGVTYLQCYDRVWNFDITDNKKDAEEMLKQPKMPPKYVLGPLKEKDDGPGGPPPGKEPGGEKLDDKKPGGPGNQRRP